MNMTEKNSTGSATDNTREREIPNPNSKILQRAIIGGMGASVPPGSAPPAGMGVVLLYVPLTELRRSLPEVQADMGLPWAVEGGGGIWFDEIAKR